MRTGSQRLAQLLRQVESPGVTTVGPDWPVFWERAHGCEVTCTDGLSYVDLTAAFGVMSVGHAHPEVVSAIQRQAECLLHGMGDVHPPAIKVRFLQALAKFTPQGLHHTILGLNGSDAVEAALKCAQLVTGRSGVIAFEGSYHGLSYGALSVTHRKDFRNPFAGRLAEQTHFVSFPSTESEADAVLSQIRQLCETDEIGAIIVEPIQGRGGVRVPAPGFLRSLKGVCKDQGILLIADEIFTGFGRTGRWFASEYEKVTPDLMCLGKAMGGGMPLSACIGGDTSVGRWPEVQGEALHTSTFLGHPMSCAAALASLEVMASEQLDQRAARLEVTAREVLAEAPVLDVRGRGMMLGLVLENGARAWNVVTRALDKGLILLPSGEDGSIISITPPLTIDESTLISALDTLISCLHDSPEK